MPIAIKSIVDNHLHRFKGNRFMNANVLANCSAVTFCGAVATGFYFFLVLRLTQTVMAHFGF